MSAKGLEVIEHTAQITHEWINELKERLEWQSHRDVLRLLRVTLHQVRDHLLIDEMAQFSAQLPLLIRGMFFEGWVPKRTPIKQRHAVDFISDIEQHVGAVLDYRGAEDIRKVFELINAKLSRSEVSDVRANLSKEIRLLWPDP
ncbi:DUF2267 domain-containing protein [Amylibacter sp. SFDW26]|uniref:DUF2267 domain-containing protein n=1 Tax=Amylibacter sp. SFDW26 TaxID=2652722 RepID=UPI0012627E24|nr:DUF2267 domain-containing protein [Amylibacter sp. SFDW26]KAB7614443.1 DUF2267 domain-containing protein [Amylibacter sp. SFDW26]